MYHRKSILLLGLCALAPSASACSETTTESLVDDSQIADAGPDASPVAPDAVTLGVDTTANEDSGSADSGRDDVEPSDSGSDAAPADEICPSDLSRVESPWHPASGDMILRDTATGSLWNARGEAFSGPCEGVTLLQLPSHNAFWFSWSISRDGHSVWNRAEPNRAGAIQPDPAGDCLVPCNEIRSGGPPPDGIPALDVDGRWSRPTPAIMVPPGDAAAAYLRDDDLVLGVAINGEAQAFPHNILWWHEIQVARVGGREINATFCPLTGSGIVIDGVQGGEPWYAYVSGRLFNSNLTMFERESDDPTFWNQMLLQGVSGPRSGEALTILPVTETTWARWLEMHPDTTVTSDETGYSRNYQNYPYGDYRSDHADTFSGTNPAPLDTYENKDLVLSVQGAESSRAYAFPELRSFGPRVAVNDEFEGSPLVVFFDDEHHFAVPFSRRVGDHTLQFEGVTAP